MVPFPVTVPYRPRPDLARLGAVVHGRHEARVLDADRNLAIDLAAKLERLRAVPHRCVGFAPAVAGDAAAVGRRVVRAARTIVAAVSAASTDSAGPPVLVHDRDRIVATVAGWSMPADPDAPFELRALRDDARPVLDWITSRPPAERPLHALGLALQEDLAWMEAPAPGASVHAAMLHVCWPSGWDPATKAGLDFAAIHAPVADGEALRAAATPLSRVLVERGPLVRFVWTLSPDAARSHHPAEVASASPDAPIHFRCERQVALPLGRFDDGAAGGAALFMIRLHVAPLDRVAPPGPRRATLHDALASMSDAVVGYKRLAALRERVLREPG